MRNADLRPGGASSLKDSQFHMRISLFYNSICSVFKWHYSGQRIPNHVRLLGSDWPKETARPHDQSELLWVSSKERLSATTDLSDKELLSNPPGELHCVRNILVIASRRANSPKETGVRVLG